MAENILVTGGAGFIGSHVAKELHKLGFHVVVLDDLSGGHPSNLSEDIPLEIGSIVDQTRVQELFQKYHFQYVFHLAAYAAEGLSHFIKGFNYQNNLIGSINLINAAVNFGVKCFVFTSSIAVYGKGKLPLEENMTPMPEDSYGIAKYAVELELNVSHEMFGLDYIIFRPHNVYGEHQNIGDNYRNVIGIFMNQIMQGKPMVVYGGGMQTRAFSYISDVAPIMARSIANPEAYNQIFNIGADKAYSINEMAVIVAKAMAVDPQIEHIQARNEVMHAYSSHEKLYRVFGKHEPVDLEEGVSRMAQWAKAVGPRQSKIFTDIEITKNMPPNWLSLYEREKTLK